MSDELQEKAELAGGLTDIVGRLEPGVTNRSPLEIHIYLASIAISLKRIADSLGNANISRW